ncbi:MAG: terminase, partial [Geminicoccaceae bacterium]
PYDNLSEGLKAANPAQEDSAQKLSFKNNSTMRVGTSLRSGTFQLLHVSEYGKICAKFPEKAREIRTGAFNTVHAGQILWVESTAEGQDGDFFQMCQDSQSAQRRGVKLSPMDFKFHFFPWWRHPQYRLEDDAVVTSEFQEYFEKLRLENGIALTSEQQAWYVSKARTQRDDMKREFPSTPKEAFAASIEGAYYSYQMGHADEEGRLCPIPYDPGRGVETWWDLGMHDATSIIWVQRVGPWFHIVDFYENSGEGLAHYAAVLAEKQRERQMVYSRHIWPHDGNVRILDEKGRQRIVVMRDLHYMVEVQERADIGPGIEAVRNLLPKCRIDSVRCDKLIKALRNYRKEWDETRGVFKDRPYHNWASHAADAMRTGASYQFFEDAEEEFQEMYLEEGRSAVTGY